MWDYTMCSGPSRCPLYHTCAHTNTHTHAQIHTPVSVPTHFKSKNVNSHFSHRQGRMSVCACVCLCYGVGEVCGGLLLLWQTCGTTNEQCLEQYQRYRWEEIWMACRWKCWLSLMSIVETMSALGHLSLFLAVSFLVISRSFKVMNVLLFCWLMSLNKGWCTHAVQCENHTKAM